MAHYELPHLNIIMFADSAILLFFCALLVNIERKCPRIIIENLLISGT